MSPPAAALRRGWLAAGLVLLVALGLWVTQPMRQAAFFLDDHLIAMIVREVDQPGWFFVHRHFFTEHLHRPMGFFSWWLLARLGPGADVQLAGNALLLVANGGLLALLLARWGVPVAAALLGAALWITHPASVVFTSWAANRFELLATALGLGCLLAWTVYLQDTRSRGAARVAVACAIGALQSKESAVLLAPLVLAMVFATDRSQPGPWRRRLLATAALVVTLVAGLAAARLLLDVRLPAEVIEANQGLAWMQGIAKWWRHLPALLLAGLQPPALAQTLSLGLLPYVVLALAAGAGWRALRSCAPDPTAAWPLLVGGLIVLAMPVIQVGHLSLATMAFLDAQGRMTGLFVERFYFQGLMGLVMMAGGGVAALRTVPPRLRAGMALGLGTLALVLLAWQVRTSLHATRTWPQVTAEIRAQATTAVQALQDAGAGRDARCRARFEQSPSPVFRALTEGMVKAVAAERGVDIARCIVESDADAMITLTHRDRLADHRVKVDPAGLPRVGQWVFLRPTLADAPAAPVTHTFRFDAATRRFVPVAP